MIVAITASAMMHYIKSAEGLFDEYITKPIDLPVLLDFLKKYVRYVQ